MEGRSEARHAAERLAAEWGREKAELKAANEALAQRIVSGLGRGMMRLMVITPIDQKQ